MKTNKNKANKWNSPAGGKKKKRARKKYSFVIHRYHEGKGIYYLAATMWETVCVCVCVCVCVLVP